MIRTTAQADEETTRTTIVLIAATSAVGRATSAAAGATSAAARATSVTRRTSPEAGWIPTIRRRTLSRGGVRIIRRPGLAFLTTILTAVWIRITARHRGTDILTTRPVCGTPTTARAGADTNPTTTRTGTDASHTTAQAGADPSPTTARAGGDPSPTTAPADVRSCRTTVRTARASETPTTPRKRDVMGMRRTTIATMERITPLTKDGTPISRRIRISRGVLSPTTARRSAKVMDRTSARIRTTRVPGEALIIQATATTRKAMTRHTIRRNRRVDFQSAWETKISVCTGSFR